MYHPYHPYHPIPIQNHPKPGCLVNLGGFLSHIVVGPSLDLSPLRWRWNRAGTPCVDRIARQGGTHRHGLGADPMLGLFCCFVVLG